MRTIEVTINLSMYEVMDSDETGIDLVIVQSGKPKRFFSNYTIDSDDDRDEDGDVKGFYLNNSYTNRVPMDKAMFLVSLMKLKEVSKNEIV